MAETNRPHVCTHFTMRDGERFCSHCWKRLVERPDPGGIPLRLLTILVMDHEAAHGLVEALNEAGVVYLMTKDEEAKVEVVPR